MASYPELCMMIDGEAVAGGGRRTFPVTNPATGAVIGALPLAEIGDLDRALAAAERGFAHWRKASAQTRAAVLEGAARLLEERREEIARIATLEQGKTLAETRIEVMMNVNLFRFYAGEVQRLYGRVLVRPEGQRATVVHEPVGPVAAFAPWNFPLGNPGRKLAAPIAAGCSVILKAAEETPASALAVLQCFYDAGLPGDVAQAVFGDPAQVSSYLLASPIIRKLSFTGSTEVGKALMKLAADDLKRTTMELGGHGPCWCSTMSMWIACSMRSCRTSSAMPGRSASRQPASSCRRASMSSSLPASPSVPRPCGSATGWQRKPRWGRWPMPAAPKRWSA